MSFELKRENGRTGLFMDGNPVPPVLYALSDFPGAKANTYYAYKNIKNFAEKGISFVAADSSLYIGWHKNYPFNCDAIMAEMESVLDANPNAKIFLRLHLNPPYWWLRDNIEECVVYRTEDGDVQGIDDGEQERLIQYDLHKNLRASFASEKWREQTSEKFVEFLNSIKSERIKNALVGIQIAYGIYGEWHQWGCDVSAPMKKRFVAFLKEKYQTVENLQKAWGRKDIDFESAEFMPQPFFPTDDLAFRNPEKSQHIIDAQTCIQKTTTDTIIHFASLVKKHAPNLLCGAFYGYYFGLSATGVIGGHLNIDELYKAGVIDYLCGPYCYMKNRFMEGVPMQRSFLESHRLHNLLWLTEMDQFPLGIETCPGGSDENFVKNVALLRRETLQPIFAGQGFWYYDHRLVPSSKTISSMGDVNSDVASIYRKRGWWDSPKMMNEIEKVQKFIGDFSKREYKNGAEVLIVSDAEARYYQHKIKDNDNEYALIESVARNGVGYDCIYLSDLSICEVDRYKCIIFANCPQINEQTKKIIKEKLKGKTCVFLNATGYSNGQNLSAKNISSVVGFELERTNEDKVKLVDSEQEIIINDCNLPAFSVKNSDNAKVLAYFDNGKVAGVKRDNIVYLSLPYLPSMLAKEIFKDASVHCWTDNGSIVYCASGYLAVYSNGREKQNITLKNGENLEYKTNEYEVAVFDIESKERVL